MLIGECPYCGNVSLNPICQHPPAFQRLECDSCNRIYWLRHSRVDSFAMTDDDFRRQYDVDDETMTVTGCHAPELTESVIPELAEIVLPKLADAPVDKFDMPTREDHIDWFVKGQEKGIFDTRDSALDEFKRMIDNRSALSSVTIRIQNNDEDDGKK